MIKNYTQYINEDLRSKKIYSEITCDNLKSINSGIRMWYDVDYRVIISCGVSLMLDGKFYQALKNDDINKDDIIFENCKGIELKYIPGFTTVADYGKFGTGIKTFNCASCKNLTSLKGCPDVISGDFFCNNCENLTSLEFCSQTTGKFSCSRCIRLQSLKFCPEVVESFYCSDCVNLTTFEFAPKEVSCGFYCSRCAGIETLEFTPDKVGGNFYCYGCTENFLKLAIRKYGNKVKS